MDLFEIIRDMIGRRGWRDLVELLIIGTAVFAVMRFLRGTRGARLLRGFFFLLLGSMLILNLVANVFDLERIRVLYPYFVGALFLSGLVAFQPELRRALIRLGAATWFGDARRDVDRVVSEVVEAAAQLSKHRMGAIIAFERNTEFRALAEGGCKLDAELSKELLLTIFWPGSPLHDLGVIISQGRVSAAAVQFPMGESDEFDASLGSRHRAAIGMSEESDALVLVVSEETGTISLVENGEMQRFLTADSLRDMLKKRLGAPASARTLPETTAG